MNVCRVARATNRAGTAAGERGLGLDELKPERTVGAQC